MDGWMDEILLMDGLNKGRGGEMRNRGERGMGKNNIVQ
jgi:hypothetical protein